jgi:hypothetical protein
MTEEPSIAKILEICARYAAVVLSCRNTDALGFYVYSGRVSEAKGIKGKCRVSLSALRLG